MKIRTTSFFDKISKALKAELPFVAYRHPQTDAIKGFFQKDTALHFSIAYSESGFVFAPFDNAEATVLFPLSASDVYSTMLSEIDFEDAMKQTVLQLRSTNAKVNHVSLVQKGIDFLKTTGAKKVVLSRKELIEYSDFDLITTFKKLLTNYTNAMVYVWFHPKVGLWMGATPETLLKIKDGVFQTMALAGTQAYHGNLDVIWEAKERQEQQFVTDYIIEKLDNNLTISKPRTIRAGSLVHLCTLVTGNLSQEYTLRKLVKSLHPTPAVCGLPMQEAKAFILKNEGYEREFYTGFLGELNLNERSNLFVNLRCMQVLPERLAIYIGGGITLDSIPQKEWEETVAKSDVMLNILGDCQTQVH